MALITCPECGQSVSDHAVACPKCGYPVKRICTVTISQSNNRKPPAYYAYYADDIPEQEPDYIADCFDGDWQMFEDNKWP